MSTHRAELGHGDAGADPPVERPDPAADGTTYLGANRNGLDEVDLTGFQFAPDIPVHGSFVVEMPGRQVAWRNLIPGRCD